jgi:hypothetical protein
VNALVADRFSTTSPIQLSSVSSSSAIVAWVAVPASGEYLVQATATGETVTGGYLRCHTVGEGSPRGYSYSPTPFGYNNADGTVGTMAENGVIYGVAGGEIMEVCFTDAQEAYVSNAALTAEPVSSVNGAKATKPAHLRPVNRYVPWPKPLRGGTRRVNGARGKGK